MLKIVKFASRTTAFVLMFTPIALSGIGAQAVAILCGYPGLGIAAGLCGSVSTMFVHGLILKAGIYHERQQHQQGFLTLLKR
jgi:hypothetical protein